MRWILKAATQRGISLLPNATAVNYQFQTRVSKGLPRSEDSFRLHLRETLIHFETLLRHRPDVDPGRLRAYEFGAGWDLITPLTLSCLGIGHQTLVDIRRNVHVDLINDTLRRLGEHQQYLQERAPPGVQVRPLPPLEMDSMDDLERLGIRYLAPLDARHTHLEAESIDFISSTYTLEHIPEADISAIFRECRRLLGPEGLISSAIDMQDHYSFSDPSISAYNYLKFKPRMWWLINSSIHYQNRLRLSDHERLHEGAGIQIIERRVEEPSEEDLEVIRKMDIAPHFRESYSLEDLGARSVLLVGQRGNE